MSSVHPVYELIIWTKEIVNKLNYEIIKDFIQNFPEYYYKWWINLLKENPYHVVIETGLMCFIIWLLFIRKSVDPNKESKTKLSQKEIDWLVETWKPEPLVSHNNNNTKNEYIVEKINGNYIDIEGMNTHILNLSSHDFLCLGQQPSTRSRAREALQQYGCGSCGPRGFYGTIDVHLALERALATFMATEQSILYSDGASAVTSCIPAYSKKGDVLLVDEGVSEPVRTGLNLSRSTVHYFKHNDVQDLTNLLETIAKDDKKHNRDALQQRRFIVVEGLYHLTGDLCPLPEILKLKNKYCYRIIMDESLSFGVIGNTGRGVTEHYGINIHDIDMITVAMDTTLASVGGGCIGTREVVDHQRLSGSGYCFSASAPPFLFASAIETLNQLKLNGPDLLITLRSNIKACINGLESIPHIEVISCEESPVIQIALNPSFGYQNDLKIMQNIAEECLQYGIAVIATTFDERLTREMIKTNTSLRATLRLNINVNLTSNEIKKVLKEIKTAVIHQLGK